MSLRARLALTSAGIVLLALAIASIGLRGSAESAANNSADALLTRRVNDTRADLARNDDTLLTVRELFAAVSRNCNQAWDDRPRNTRRQGECGDSLLSSDFDATRVIWISEEGSLRTSTNYYPTSEFSQEALVEDDFVHFETVVFQDREIRVVTANLAPGAALQSARNLEDVSGALRQLISRIVVFAAVGAGVAALVGWWLAHNATKPIAALTHTSERVAQTQNLTERIPVKRRDEVGRLAASFNTMLEALDASKRQQHQLVLDANHELRTPLTSLRTNIEVLERMPNLDTADRARLLHDVRGELNELSALVEELVESATDASASNEPVQEVELIDLVESVAEMSRRRTGRIVSVESSNPVTVDVRVSMIERAIRNLISNADKFSPETAPIFVRVDGAVVQVEDMGSGIDPADRDKVFDRFYRATSARSAPGSGLGLSIVRQIIESHGGTVWATEASTGGASVGFDISATSLGSAPTTAEVTTATVGRVTNEMGDAAQRKADDVRPAAVD